MIEVIRPVGLWGVWVDGGENKDCGGHPPSPKGLNMNNPGSLSGDHDG